MDLFHVFVVCQTKTLGYTGWSVFQALTTISDKPFYSQVKPSAPETWNIRINPSLKRKPHCRVFLFWRRSCKWQSVKSRQTLNKQASLPAWQERATLRIQISKWRLAAVRLQNAAVNNKKRYSPWGRIRRETCWWCRRWGGKFSPPHRHRPPRTL